MSVSSEFALGKKLPCLVNASLPPPLCVTSITEIAWGCGQEKGSAPDSATAERLLARIPFVGFHERLRELAGRGNGSVELFGKRFGVLKHRSPHHW